MAQLTLDSRIRMNSGYEMPVLGFGQGNQPKDFSTPAEVCEKIVTFALNAGYRHVDSAIFYRNEAPCAAAILHSSIPRSELFFTTKINVNRLGYEPTRRQIVQSLMTTGLDYIDVMLIHTPHGGREKRKGTWRALVEAVELGMIRSIGVSNYGLHHLEELEEIIKELEAERGKGRGGVISVGQWEIHPWLGRKETVAWCKERGIVVQASCPLTRATRIGDEGLGKIAAKYGKSPAQVLLRWSLQKGFVPLPKSDREARVLENRDIYDFELTQEDMEGLETGRYEPCTFDPTTIVD